MTSPFTHPDEWGTVKLAGVPIPGIVVSVDGVKRPYEWAVQRALGQSGAVTIYRGENVADKIVIVSVLPDDETFSAAEDFNKYITPKKGQRPAAFDIEHPAFAYVGILKVSLQVRPAPKDEGKGKWTMTYELLEYRKPVPVPVGPADPAKIDGPPKPKDAIEQAIVDIVAQIEKA